MSKPVHAIVMRHFDASAERVFDACLDPALAVRWMFGPDVRDECPVHLTLNACVGGRFSFVVKSSGAEVDQVGEYLHIDRPRLLVFTWATRDSLPERSRVIIEVSPQDLGCDVKLTQVMGAHWSADVDRTASAWIGRLDALERAIACEEEELPV
jgi:uncharacterized protein YndB with AHSA1/START domain